MKRTVVTIFRLFSSILSLLLIIYFALVLFGVDPYSFFIPIGRYVDPFLNPIQRVVPTFAGIDFSPLIAIMILGVIEWLLRSLWGGEVYSG
ncbi:MAG: YggT family protein [Chloroflexi bacterium]|jgi:YggT family protein|nr:YggT family protein [Chloroflexota bacterium]